MLERLTSNDRRFILLCLIATTVLGGIGVRLFSRAFPEAALELKVDRDEARRLAGPILVSVAGAPPEVFEARSPWRFASRFTVGDEPKVYLERTLGLTRANQLYGREARIWSWDLRWFRSGEKEEWRAALSPLGEPVGFEHVLPESAAGARLERIEAERRALAFLAALGHPSDSLALVEATSKALPRRTDWIIEWERRGLRMGAATVRYRVGLAGAEPGSFREFVKVPEEWQRQYRRLRSANEVTGQVDSLFLLLTLLAMGGVLVLRSVRRDVPWKTVTGFGMVCFALVLLAQLNALPLSVYEYDTSSPFQGFLVRQVLFVVMGSLAQALFVGFLVAAAEPVFRERFPAQTSVRATVSWRGLKTKRCFLGILLGYAMMAGFLAYQVVFYIVAEWMGAWAPADVPYNDLLNTAFPWAMVLLIGFLPAVSEEFMSRVFSISFLDRFVRSRAVVLVVPALIWGFGHAPYPNQPFFIRGLEVGLAGVVIGWIFLRFGIVPVLVWHFTVDATYTALLLFRSGNPYYVVSGAIASGILLVPLGLSLWAYVRRGGFEPRLGLTNAEELQAPTPAPPPAAEPVPVAAEPAPLVVGPVPLAIGRPAAVWAVLGLVLLVVPAHPVGERGADTLGREGALERAREFLRARGEEPDRFRVALYTGTGFAESSDMDRLDPEDTGRLAGFSNDAAYYVLHHGGSEAFRKLEHTSVPLNYWVVRFFRPGEKGEWKIAIDSRHRRVAAFAHPRAEVAAVGPPPTPAEARERSLNEAARLGYPAARYAVIDSGVKGRPNRTDVWVTLESEADAVGQARPRLTAVFHGSELEALWPSLKLPEEFLRRRQSRGALHWVGLVARVVAGGSLLGVILWVAIGAIRGGALSVRRLGPSLSWWFLVVILSSINSWPAGWRIYPTEIPLDTFRITLVVGLIVRVVVLFLGGLVVFLLIEGAYPAWRVALRRGGRFRDAILRASVAAAGLLGLHHAARILGDRFPAALGVEGFLPGSLESFVPGYQAFFAGASSLVWLAGAAAASALAFRDPRLADRRAAWVGALLIVVVLVPLDAKSPSEALLPFLLALATTVWMVVVAVGLLREHVAAWVLFGAFLVAAGEAAALLRQPVWVNQMHGILALSLAAFAVLALVAARRASSLAQPGVVPMGGEP